jgi:hypothetical protein
VPTHTKDILSRKEAAEHLTALGYPIAPATLARFATKRRGPPYIRFGWRIVTYKRADVEAWARSESVVAGGPAVR